MGRIMGGGIVSPDLRHSATHDSASLFFLPSPGSLFAFFRVFRGQSAFLLSLLFGGFSVFAGAPDAGEKPKFVLTTTYEQRVAASARNRAPEAESLVFPHPHAANILSQPVRVKAGPLPILTPDLDAVIWQIAPWQDAFTQYLEKRGEMRRQEEGRGASKTVRPHAERRDEKASAVVDWCEANRLPLCAEFELRSLLFQNKNFQDPAYQSLLRRWLNYGDKRAIDYSFPLPAKGAWHVARDETGHHRLKAWAAYAFDLVIQKNGLPFSGSPSKLENHYAWDQPIVAQADGVVLSVVDKYRDMPPGQMGAYAEANIITIDYGGGILGFYGHHKQGTAKVKPGDRVAFGQELARVGNSGASGLPHLHLAFVDQAMFSVRGRFRCEVWRDGRWKLVDGEDLREGTHVRNPP